MLCTLRCVDMVLTFSDVAKEDLNSLPGQFCIGRTKKVDLTDTEIYSQKSEKKFDKIQEKTDDILKVLSDSNPENVESIDGGPACFGDSGESNFTYMITIFNGFPNFKLFTVKAIHFQIL